MSELCLCTCGDDSLCVQQLLMDYARLCAKRVYCKYITFRSFQDMHEKASQWGTQLPHIQMGP